MPISVYLKYSHGQKFLCTDRKLVGNEIEKRLSLVTLICTQHFISENRNGPKVLDMSVLSGRPPESQITSHTALENTDGQRKLSSLNNEVVSFLRRRATMSPASLMELPLEKIFLLAV